MAEGFGVIHQSVAANRTFGGATPTIVSSGTLAVAVRQSRQMRSPDVQSTSRWISAR